MNNKDKIQYKCNCCEAITEAIDTEEIINKNKLCDICIALDEAGRKRTRRTVAYLKRKPKEYVKIDLRRKKLNGKGVSNKKKIVKIWTFVCNGCGLDSKLNFKPYMCGKSGCKSMSFFRKEI